MNVRLTPRALSEAGRLKTWWLQNRPDGPNVFDAEMAIALEQIRAAPAVGAVYPSSFGRTVRRLLMPKDEEPSMRSLSQRSRSRNGSQHRRP
jgi:hypothetical protein